MKFTYSNPTVLFFGQGRIEAITKAIPKGKKVLVVYGGGSIKKNGIYDQVEQALENHEWDSFGGIEPNPSVQTLRKAVEKIKAEGFNFVLAVGGGSVIDGCKFLSAAALYEGDGWDLMTGKARIKEALPMGVVLTLAATGSESNTTFVVSNPEEQAKLAMLSRFVQPQFAVLDPDVLKSLPEQQIANGLVDAFVHCCEQYLTYPSDAMVQESYAEGLMISLLNLSQRFHQQDDAWRANLMLCCNQALNGFIGSGVVHDWSTHMIGHELTAVYNTDHARSLALVHGSLLRHQIETKRQKLEQLGRNVFGLEQTDILAEQTIEAIEAMYTFLNVETRLSHAIDASQAEITNAIIAQLETHGAIALGERKSIDKSAVEEIIALAM